MPFLPNCPLPFAQTTARELHAAVEADYLPRALQLLAAQPDSAAWQNERQETALHVAAMRHRAAMIGPLLQAAPEAALIQDFVGLTPLHSAIISHSTTATADAAAVQLRVVQLLLKAAPAAASLETGFNGGNTAVSLAVRCGGLALRPILELLLQAAPATAAVRDLIGRRTPLAQAASSGDAASVRLLLWAAPQAAAIPDNWEKLPVHLAAQGGHTECLRLLLHAAPATVSATDSMGKLALHAAVERCSGRAAEMVQLLLDAADSAAAIATTEDSYGRTPLWYAAHSGSTAAAMLLLAAAPAAAAIVDGMTSATPLHGAIRALGDMRCDSAFDAEDGNGQARLAAAHSARAKQALQLLLVYRLLQAAPAAALQQDENGCTPAHVAANCVYHSERFADNEPMFAVLRLLIEVAPSAATAADNEGTTPTKVLDRRATALHDVPAKAVCYELKTIAVVHALNANGDQPPAAPADHRLCLRTLARLPDFVEVTATAASTVAADATTTATMTVQTTQKLTAPAPTFAAVVARQPLIEEEWQEVPGSDPCLASALPAVLERSEAEARWLVARLPEVGCCGFQVKSSHGWLCPVLPGWLELA